ncbi:MAG: bifunctional adenosylcobinamide kinase/adenosylcobinamide-phosphate guanylyltransferase [Chloroflexota bacterium]
MTKKFTLILGGARSGKSTYAEKLAAESGRDVLYVATAQAWDDDMKARIAVHKAERPSHWQTLEVTNNVGEAITTYIQTNQFDDCPTILLDCMTMLASNVVLALPEPILVDEATDALHQEVDGLLQVYEANTMQLIIVSNEVGLGIVPAYPLGRVYRDALGRANQRLATQADEVLFMVAGLPMRVK